MPTITQMAYLEKRAGHLTEIRRGADSAQIPSPTSMILTGLFVCVTVLGGGDTDQCAVTTREPSVVVFSRVAVTQNTHTHTRGE